MQINNLNYMKYLYCIIICVSCFKINIFSQNIIKEGIYKGGICADNAICGFWVLKENKTFVFCDFNGNYLNYFGSGKWTFINDTILNFLFDGSKIPIYEESKVNYISQTKSPTDSIYIRGRILDKSFKSVLFASVILNNKFQTITDTDGFFTISLPNTVLVENLIVLDKLNGFKPIELHLNNNNNHHDINVLLPSFDSTSYYYIYNSNPFMVSKLLNPRLNLNLNKNSFQKNKYLSITLFREDLSWVIEMLNKAKQLQPLIAVNIDQLLSIIKNDF